MGAGDRPRRGADRPRPSEILSEPPHLPRATTEISPYSWTRACSRSATCATAGAIPIASTGGTPTAPSTPPAPTASGIPRTTYWASASGRKDGGGLGKGGGFGGERGRRERRGRHHVQERHGDGRTRPAGCTDGTGGGSCADQCARRGPAPGPPAAVLPRDHVRQPGADHRRARAGDGDGDRWPTPSPPGGCRRWPPRSGASSAAPPAGLRVFQDFFIDIDLPVALTQNDEISIPIAVYNYLPGAADGEADAGEAALVRAGER